MKKMISGCVVCVAVTIYFTMDVFAVSSQKSSLDLTSAFMSQAHVAENNFVVPTMIDVPVLFDMQARMTTLIVDRSDVIVPSTVVTHTKKDVLNFQIKDSFDTKNIQNVMDGAYDTFVDFPFEENMIVDEQIITSDENGKIVAGERMENVSLHNRVVIDIEAERSFVSDTLSLAMEDYVAAPTHIRIASVDENGTEHVIVPEMFFTQPIINYPKTTARHYRVSIAYARPLRINEVMFVERQAPQEIQRSVRFVAQPGHAYEIYYNAIDPIQLPDQEMPNFHESISVPVIQPMQAGENILYKGADADKDGIIDRYDNCLSIANADQADKNDNTIGDECEDFDHDGVINALDNCVDVVNHAQTDADHDGMGDACDDTENRFMEKYPWIPYIALVAVFFVITGLIVKTLKKND